MPASQTVDFDPSRHARLSDQVSLRDEEFGALAYHHGTRRLVFIKSPKLLALLRHLDDFDTVGDALAASVELDERASYGAALGALWRSGLLGE